jgi:hypothetical protein
VTTFHQGQDVAVTECGEDGRDDLNELAALLDEIRQTWRPMGWPQRDRMRRLVLEGLYRFRAQEAPGVQPPDDCPWDVSGLIDEPRERLLSGLRNALFNEAQLRDKCARILTGSRAQERDLKETVARCAELIRRDRKTVPMEALRAAVWPEMTQ